MEYHSLILGVLLSIGIFAVKSGTGLAYLFAGQERLKNRIIGFIIFSLSYMAVFFAAELLISNINPEVHLMKIQKILKSGMLIHIVMAFFMLLWGVLLLRHKGSDHKKSKGWMLLAFPCPVCITVIFISLGFLITLYPDNPKTVVSGLYAAFIGINLFTVICIGLYRKHRDVELESFLGSIMLLIAVYFIVSVTVMPHFSDIDKVYRLATYKGNQPPQELLHIVPFLLLTVFAFAGGFILKLNKIKRSFL